MSAAETPFMAGGGDLVKKTFINHVFSTTDESKSEIMNILQYAGLAIIPVVALNKIIQRFIPDADPDKSSLEITFEILLQILIIFCGIVIIHRAITYLPTYSGYPYGNLLLTNSTITFLIIVLSIQTKMGIKVNIIADRLMDMWNGDGGGAIYSRSGGGGAREAPKSRPPASAGHHTPSQADNLDNSFTQTGVFPPAPVSTTKGGSQKVAPMESEPVAANSLLGSFGGSFF